MGSQPKDMFTKYDIDKFTVFNDFGLWQLKMRVFFPQQRLLDALDGDMALPKDMKEEDKRSPLLKAHNALRISLLYKVLREVSK